MLPIQQRHSQVPDALLYPCRAPLNYSKIKTTIRSFCSATTLNASFKKNFTPRCSPVKRRTTAIFWTRVKIKADFKARFLPAGDCQTPEDGMVRPNTRGPSQ